MRVVVAAAVGAVLRLVGRLDRFDPGAELFEHGLEHIVVGQAQPAVAQLQGDVAVAQVVGGAHQLEGAGAGDVQQLFGAGLDAHDAAVPGLQAFAVLQRRLAALEEQADLFAGRGEAAQAALAAGLEAQLQFGVPVGLGGNALVDHQHGAVSSSSMVVTEQGACQRRCAAAVGGLGTDSGRNRGADRVLFGALPWLVRRYGAFVLPAARSKSASRPRMLGAPSSTAPAGLRSGRRMVLERVYPCWLYKRFCRSSG